MCGKKTCNIRYVGTILSECMHVYMGLVGVESTDVGAVTDVPATDVPLL